VEKREGGSPMKIDSWYCDCTTHMYPFFEATITCVVDFPWQRLMWIRKEEGLRYPSEVRYLSGVMKERSTNDE